MSGYARSDRTSVAECRQSAAKRGEENHVQVVQAAAALQPRSRWLLGLARARRRPQAEQTIDDIIKKGKIVVGVSTTTPIFGLIGKDGAARRLRSRTWRACSAKYLGVQVEFVPVTGANRIPQPAERPRRRADLPVRHHARARAAGLVFDALCQRGCDAGRAREPQVKTVDDLDGLKRRRAARRHAGPDADAARAGQEDQPPALRRRGHRAAGADLRPDRPRAAPACWSIAAEPQRSRQELRGQDRAAAAAFRHRHPPRRRPSCCNGSTPSSTRSRTTASSTPSAASGASCRSSPLPVF